MVTPGGAKDALSPDLGIDPVLPTRPVPGRVDSTFLVPSPSLDMSGET